MTLIRIEPLFQPPLRALGRDIVDVQDARFKLISINWYGGSDEFFVPGGLDFKHRCDIAALIRRMGFNSVRLPYSDELVVSNPPIPDHSLTANPDLHGLHALDVFKACVNALTDAGLAVIVNNHITRAKWFDGLSLCDATWHNEYLGPFCGRLRQTEDQWIEHWETIMSPFIDNPRVIGADLRNEVHGFWGTMNWNTWATAAERASERLLQLQPKWLMFVEGISSANDLSGVLDRPIELSIPGRVVYSAHVYSWSGWGDMSPFSSRPFPDFARAMQKNWAYILEADIAPVWIGEMGVGKSPSKGDAHYWKNLIRYLREVDVDVGYWALNPRKPHDNEEETYGLVQDDWATVIRDFRLQDLMELAETPQESATRRKSDHQTPT
ncbi:hypothetical protein MMC09_004839 [Bachmanniomyces sp. S44760]|nr:hypothetical protein [Bachmanniomyces sp. S44760]